MSLTQEHDYVMAGYRNIQINPVKAGMAEISSAYRWSSHRANAIGGNDPLVVSREHLASLASTSEQ